MLISWFGGPHLAHIWGKGWPLLLPAGDGSIASCAPPWYDEPMDTTPFELTPEHKGMLASLSQETGKPVATLLAAIAAALEELQAARACCPCTGRGQRARDRSASAAVRPYTDMGTHPRDVQHSV